MSDAHIVNVGLFHINAVGSVVNKNNAIATQTQFSTEPRIIPTSGVTNSQGYPSISTYLQAEANDGYILVHLDQYLIVTIYGGNGLDGHRTISVIDSDTTLTIDQDIILVTATSTVTLPSADYSTTIGQRKTYTIKNWASDIIVTVATTDGQTIDGDTTVALDQRYKSITMISDGSNWAIIGRA